MVAEAAHEVSAVLVVAGEAGTSHFNHLIFGGFDVAEGRRDGSDVRSGVVKIRLASLWVQNVVPLLLVECNLHENFHWSANWRQVPGPLINRKVIWRNFDVLGNWNFGVGIYQSYPKSVIEVWAGQHISEALKSLVVGSIGWTSGWIVE